MCMKYLTVQELSEKFSLTERTIRNRCVNGYYSGAIKKGKKWLIPESVCLDENGQFIEYAREMLDFIDRSPVSFFVISNSEEILKEKGYRKIDENNLTSLKTGEKIYFVRNGSSLIALNIGEDVKEESYTFHIVASHDDSPSFKIKPNAEGKTDIYNKINVEGYGGMICSSWLDRPLSIAGRIIYKDNSGLKTKLINIDKDLLFIPNQCIHFNRNINSGYAYNAAIDMQPLLGQYLNENPFMEAVAKQAKIKKEDIYNFDLYLYNHEKGRIVSSLNEEGYILSSRLDDQECVYASLDAFVHVDNKDAINVLYIADNEEVGSSTQQGANSDYLDTIFRRIYENLGFSYNSYINALNRSFLISADNAHAVHPNNPATTDANNKVYMNKGIAIKFNAAQSYCTDGISAAIMQEICNKAKVPFQFFTNRSDIRGGGTLGNILLSHVSLKAVDIGLPQLAMHSCYESAGIKDAKYLFLALQEFYKSNIIFRDDCFSVI